MDQQDRPRFKILVVDDDELNQRMMRVLLSDLGHEIQAAANGEEALEALQQEPFDLVFMDLQLPVMDGLEVCRRIRSWEAGRCRIPVVALTAYDIPGKPLELFKAGMDDYIFKPYSLVQLSRIINLYTGEAGSADAFQREQPSAVSLKTKLSFDPQNALLNFPNDPDLYRQLLTEYFLSLPGKVERLLQAQNTGNWKDLAIQAHNLKGVSLNLGLLRLSRLAVQLEADCALGEGVKAAETVHEIQNHLIEVQDEVKGFLGMGRSEDPPSRMVQTGEN